MKKLSKKGAILTGVGVAVIAALGSAAMLAPQDVKDRALHPFNKEEAAPAAQPEDAPVLRVEEEEVDNGTPKKAS